MPREVEEQLEALAFALGGQELLPERVEPGLEAPRIGIGEQDGVLGEDAPQIAEDAEHRPRVLGREP